jgi:glycosyltransferase involved in cell wall biosynthesis
MLRQFDRMACNSAAEQRLAQKLCNWSGAAKFIGMPVDPFAGELNYEPPGGPYILYCGRIDKSKGAGMLFEYFLGYRQQANSGLKLVLTGTAVMEIPHDPAIIFLGFVEEGVKRALMRNAAAFVHPSAFESLSIVLLESFLEGTPALVNSESEVMVEHCRTAKAGLTFSGYREFAEQLTLLTTNKELRNCMGENGKRYVELNYSRQRIAAELRNILESETDPALQLS